MDFEQNPSTYAYFPYVTFRNHRGPTFSNTFIAGLIIGLVLIATGLWAIVLKLFRANQSAKKLLGFLIATVAIAFTSAAVLLIVQVVTTPGSRY